MCLGIPGLVTETYHENNLFMGKVDFGGVTKRVCFEHVPDIKIGEYAIVHVGFALTRVNEDEAKQIFQFLKQMNDLDEMGVEQP